MNTPHVFISSTFDDLKRFRQVAKDAALRAECFPRMMEAWPAQAADPLQVCLDEVDRADALVVIVAHRYGWTPPVPPQNGIRQSVTWLECQRAMDTGKPVLAFLIHADQRWDETLREEYQATSLLKSGELTALSRVYFASTRSSKTSASRLSIRVPKLYR